MTVGKRDSCRMNHSGANSSRVSRTFGFGRRLTNVTRLQGFETYSCLPGEYGGSTVLTKNQGPTSFSAPAQICLLRGRQADSQSVTKFPLYWRSAICGPKCSLVWDSCLAGTHWYECLAGLSGRFTDRPLRSSPYCRQHTNTSLRMAEIVQQSTTCRTELTFRWLHPFRHQTTINGLL